MDRNVVPPGDRPTPRQRAGEIAALIQQAQAACRACGADLNEPRASQLFEKIAGYLDVAIVALQSYEREEPPHPRRTMH
jgi:hypothetical protein